MDKAIHSSDHFEEVRKHHLQLEEEAKEQARALQRRLVDDGEVAELRRRLSLDKLAAEAHRSQNLEFNREQQKILSEFSEAIAAKEAKLLEIKLAQAQVLHNIEMEKRSEKAREVAGLERFKELHAFREKLEEETRRTEEELIAAKLLHAEELHRQSVAKIAEAARTIDDPVFNRASLEPLHAGLAKKAAAKEVETRKARMEKSEHIRSASLENIVQRVKSVDHDKEVAQTREHLNQLEAEKTRKELEELELRETAALERHRKSLEKISAHAHQSLHWEEHATINAQLEKENAERAQKLRQELEASAEAALQRRRASLDHKARVAHSDLERVALDVARHEEMQRQKMELLLADQKLKGLYRHDSVLEDATVSKATAVPNNTPADRAKVANDKAR